MKSYIKDNAYLITNQILNQFGAAIMGLILSAAVGQSSNTTLIIATGIFTIGFFLVLQYTSLWDAGARDIIRVEGNRLPYRPYAGFVMSVFANIPNFIIAILVIVGWIFGMAQEYGGMFDYAWADKMYTTGRFIGLFWESMYNNLIRLYSPHNPIAFLLVPIPGMVAAGLGYYAGMKNFTIIRIKKKEKKNK